MESVVESIMFCYDRIKNIYSFSSLPDNDEEDCLMDFYHDLSYHITRGIGYLLETENWMIIVDFNGASKIRKTVWKLPKNRQMSSLKYVSKTESQKILLPEYTLFIGERLVSVEEKRDKYILHFEDFDFKIIPYGTIQEFEDKYPYDDSDDSYDGWWHYKHVNGFERLIRKKCPCGGSGELICNNLDDYGVRCKICGDATDPYMEIADAIRSWNAGKLNWRLPNVEVINYNSEIN